MILKEDSTEQKLRGAYYTPQKVAWKMAGFFKDMPIRKILEPSCGNGVFIEAALGSQLLSHDGTMTAIDIEGSALRQTSERIGQQEKIRLLHMDFFQYYEEHKEDLRYDLILGNPPYIRYQYLKERQREEMSRILTEHGMKANKLINTWVGFLVACVHLLQENGKIAFVIPAEILQVAYAQELRLFLAKELSNITLLTFEELVFPDIEQEILILIGEKGTKEKGIRIIELNNLDDLDTLDLDTNGFQKLSRVQEKWTKYFMNPKENNLVACLRKDRRFQKMSDLALINIGITTGNNKYFSVTQNAVD